MTIEAFSLFIPVTNHAAIWTLGHVYAAHQASLGHESTSRVTRFELLIHHHLLDHAKLFF